MGRWIFIFILVIHLAPIGDALASVEWKNQKSLPLNAVPRQVTISPDGRMVYVLAQGGVVFIYSGEGKLEDTINVGEAVDSIAVSPDGNTLLLADRVKKSIEVIKLDFIYEINISGSPSKGPQDAAVAIVVFSDFQ